MSNQTDKYEFLDQIFPKAVFSVENKKANINNEFTIFTSLGRKFHMEQPILIFWPIYKNPEISFIFNKTLASTVICDKCDSNDKKVREKKESIWILKIFGLTNNIEERQIKITE